MIKQIMGGSTIKTINVTASDADITKLQSILVGKLEIYEKKGEGGTKLSAVPTGGYNAKSFSVGSKNIDGSYKSAFVRLPHVKSSKSWIDIHTAVVGAFDESVDSSGKCEYAKQYYDKYNH